MLINLKHRQRGIGLLELMLSLGLIAILLVMAIRFYQATRTNQQITQTMSDVQGIIGAGTQWSQDGNDVSNISFENLHKSGLLPKGIDKKGAFGGAVTLTGGDVSYKDPEGTEVNLKNGMKITIDSIPPLQCESLGNKLQGSARSAECSNTTLTVIFN